MPQRMNGLVSGGVMEQGEQVNLKLGRRDVEFGKPSRFLMLVKTYPIPSATYEETVCCAGIDAETRAWIRMYPVNFRSLAEYARFKKWQFIEATWVASTRDARPESRRVHQDTIRAGEFLAAGSGWPARRRWLDPLVDSSLESLKTEQIRVGKSLGAIRPKKIRRFIIRNAASWDKAATQGLEQLSMQWTDSATPRGDLERIPFDFLYEFECDDESCQGHSMEIFDWELAQAYRNFRRRYPHREGPRGWEAMLRHKYEVELPARDLHLLLGTHHRWQNWLIVGVVAPPHVQVREIQRGGSRHRVGKDGAMTLPWVELEAQERDRLAAGEVDRLADGFGGTP